MANHFGVFFGLVSAYSQNDVIGTRHRDSGLSHRRQCGDLVFLMLVVMPGYCGGFGMPHRIMISSRSPSAARATGAMAVGEDRRQRRQVAGDVSADLEQVPDRLLICRH